MDKKLLLTTVALIVSIHVFSQALTDSIKWKDISEIQELFKENQKPVFVYFYKDGCDSCREIEKTTFSNPEVANYINILFYPIKIDAETKDTLKYFDGKYYVNSEATGKYHDLTHLMAGQTDTFPCIVIFSRRAEGTSFAGYKNRDEIFRPLIYYAENIDRAVEYEDWEKYHKKGYPPGMKQIMTRLIIKWKKLDEAIELNKTKPRKMLLNFYNYNNISCTLMRTQTYNHPVTAKYLNEKYYPVSVDVYTKDTLSIFGIDYINENKPYKYHQLPIAALEGKMTFPAYIILDEAGKVLHRFRKYQTPEMLEKYLKFYGSNKYKSITFGEFTKTFKSEIE